MDAGLTTSLPASDPGSTEAWGSKDKPSVSVLLVSDLEWMPFQTRMTSVHYKNWSSLSIILGFHDFRPEKEVFSKNNGLHFGKVILEKNKKKGGLLGFLPKCAGKSPKNQDCPAKIKTYGKPSKAMLSNDVVMKINCLAGQVNK